MNKKVSVRIKTHGFIPFLGKVGPILSPINMDESMVFALKNIGYEVEELQATVVEEEHDEDASLELEADEVGSEEEVVVEEEAVETEEVADQSEVEVVEGSEEVAIDPTNVEDLKTLTNSELKAILDQRQVAYAKKDTKDELIEKILASN